MSRSVIALLSLVALTTVARADALDTKALVDKLPWRFTVDEHARPSPVVDDAKAVARRAVTLTATEQRGAPLVYSVTMVTYPSAAAATARRTLIEDQALGRDTVRDRSLPPLPLGKEHQLVFQKGALLVHATASCSFSEANVRTIHARLLAQLGPLPMGPLRCACGGICVVEK